MFILACQTEKGAHQSEGSADTKLIAAMNQLRERLYLQHSRNLPARAAHICQLVKDAETEAWRTPFPHLFLPDLVEIKMTRLSLLEGKSHQDGTQPFAQAA
jgi:hypothetical protein